MALSDTVLPLALLVASSCVDSGIPGPSAGKGTVSGAVGAHALSSVQSAYVIGHADDPAGTIVVYVFDAPVSCSELGSPGWDSRIADGTGVLELKLVGKAAGTHPVAAMAQSKQASVNFVLSSRSGTPKEQSASGGSVQLDEMLADGTGRGSFDLTFGADATKGTFAAAPCAQGHEP